MTGLTAKDRYDMTIGIECHVQLATKTKLFSGADNDARNAESNTAVNPIDFGLPGMLPVINRYAVELAVRAGKALGAAIAPISRFDRKHYFYPDLPKGYQTTQMYQPIIIGGAVEAPLDDGTTVTVRLHHAHMEEDAGKLSHHGTYSLVDLNRAGTPLIEIVSEPDIHSAQAARAYATELHKLMTYAGVSYGDLFQGNMRFDVNVSIAPKGATELGTRAEVKNLNSFRSVERAAEYEFERQAAVLDTGESVVQETRGWDDSTGKTSSQRSKEDAQDYRYMPDADIPPIILTPEDIEQFQADMPVLPAQYRTLWQPLGFDRSVTESLLADRRFAELIATIQSQAGDDDARRVGHWFASSLGGESDTAQGVSNVDAAGYIELSTMVGKNELSSTAAKELFGNLIHDATSPRQRATENGLLQVNDASAIEAFVDDVLADPASERSIADIKDGQEKAYGFLVGQVMKRSAGSANPGAVQALLRQKLQG